ncbi:MAG: pyruvate:ferredoxin (flavodoxin) oxidoreductase, partial [Planctomycetota bacterium]
VHGALQAGALATTFTASQGLLLMIPNMFKIAGELSSTVFHVASRTVATHALSIFGDHSDVMAARSTGFAMLCSSTVQEAHDFALLAQAASLEGRVPFLHFFDGFRTSHEVNKIEVLDDDDFHALIQANWIAAHRCRALDPDRPVLRGSAQNPDVFFQAREAANLYYEQVPGILQGAMERLRARTGRSYRLFDYIGDPDAERVAVLMGSGTGAVEETVAALNLRGEKVGLLKVRLFLPFDSRALVAALPPGVRRLAVLDRTKEPGAPGEPLFQQVVCGLAEAWPASRSGSPPQVFGGRYGLSSKEFTPAMAAGVFEELQRGHPRRSFTVGIIDDVTRKSLPWDPEFSTGDPQATRAVFFGLGSDGTVGACKNAVKIIGQETQLFAQGYFVYDSKKAGGITISHLRFGRRPIHSSYLIRRASFLACHQFNFLERMEVLELAEKGATFLLNCPYGPGEVWGHLPREVQEEILAKELRFFVVDAARVAREAGLGGRINTAMQTCFFELSRILPSGEAIEKIKGSIRKAYGRRGESILERNFAAVDGALQALHEVTLPAKADSGFHRRPPVPESAPDFVQRVTSLMLAGKGDLLPVSALPVDGTFPVGTARWEKRSIAHEIPIWDAGLCIECNLCALVCPHAAIRVKSFDAAVLSAAPGGFPVRTTTSKEFPGNRFSVQVAPDDCTGCGICVQSCPARSKEVARHKAIDMLPQKEHLEEERRNFRFFLEIPEADREEVKMDTVRGSQLLQPLFEFSGACAGCGETPYIKILTQLFGERMVVANATGCSSIYGGNLPTTPWSADSEGRGPAWNNSLFEDNAEFGLGMRLSLDHQERQAREWVQRLAGTLGDELTKALLAPTEISAAGLAARRRQVAVLKERLQECRLPEAEGLLALADVLIPRTVWVLGGDGWAYDIGFGGLDHVLASNRNVNLLVLDTGVYSNTGGQASKATPRAAVAKFAAAGKNVKKKDLGLLAMAYGNVYVAQIALGAQPRQTIQALAEAESFPGPSLLIAYSHCIAHGIEISTAMQHQKEASQSGFWPLFRYDPRLAHEGSHPLQIDSRKPRKPFSEFAAKEGRFAILRRTDPQRAERLIHLAQRDIEERWRLYHQIAGLDRENVDLEEGSP